MQVHATDNLLAISGELKRAKLLTDDVGVEALAEQHRVLNSALQSRLRSMRDEMQQALAERGRVSMRMSRRRPGEVHAEGCLRSPSLRCARPGLKPATMHHPAAEKHNRQEARRSQRPTKNGWRPGGLGGAGLSTLKGTVLQHSRALSTFSSGISYMPYPLLINVQVWAVALDIGVSLSNI